MYTFIIGLIIFFAVLLVLVILAQNSKGGGLTSQFGGSAASNIIGVKKTGDLLEKLTWGFVIAIMVLSMSTSFITPNTQGPSNDILERVVHQRAGGDCSAHAAALHRGHPHPDHSAACALRRVRRGAVDREYSTGMAQCVDHGNSISGRRAGAGSSGLGHRLGRVRQRRRAHRRTARVMGSYCHLYRR